MQAVIRPRSPRVTEEFKNLVRELVGMIASVLAVAAIIFAVAFWLASGR
jgi:hypothetical protein